MSRRSAVVDAPVEGPAVLDLAGLGAAPRPQVNLLPPEVHSRRALGRAKVRLVLVLVAVVVLAGLGYAYAMLQDNSAASALAAQQAEVTRLQAEQAQYAEVPQINSQITRIEKGRTYAMSTEVLLSGYIGSLQAVTPQGVTIQDLAITLPTPGTPAGVAANPLAGESIATIAFNVQSPTVPDIGAWMDAIESIPGFADATFSAAQRGGNKDGQSFYRYSATVQVQSSVFSNRFAEGSGQ